MKPLVLTGWLMPDFTKNDFADLALDFAFSDFVCGPQPSPDELAAHLGPRTANHGQHLTNDNLWRLDSAPSRGRLERGVS